MRGIKGLPLSVHYAFGARVEGYGLNGGDSWNIPGADASARNLHEIYTIHNPGFTGRVTVPILWDAAAQKIISNESTNILAIMDLADGPKQTGFTLRPHSATDEIESANAAIHAGLNNAVYRAGFAQGQSAYDEAVGEVFDTLDVLEQRLATSRYYFGDLLTETDLRIFPTLVRFDAIYAILFRCCLRRLVDYEHLWAYARDIYNHRGVAETVDFTHMRQASYLADSDAPHPIVAVAPDEDWTAPQSRSEFGPTKIALRDGGVVAVDPETLQPLPDRR